MFTTFNRVGLTKIDSTRGLVFYRKDVSTISYYIVDFAPATPTFGSESTITAASIGADFFTDDIDAVYLDDGRIVIGNVADIGAAPNEIFYYVLDSL